MTKLRRRLQQILSEKQGLIIGYVGTLGKLDGTVAVPDNPNHVYVRMVDQPISEVYNTRVPYIPELKVIVGFDPLQPYLWQVLTEAPNYSYGVTGSEVPVISPHAETHRWMGGGVRGGTDIVWVEGRQIMPFRITGSGLTIFVHRGVYHDGTQWREVAPSTVIDLESEVPATSGKGLYVLVTLDDSGSIQTTTGSEVDAVDLAITDIPAPPPGTRYIIGAIRLYEGQDNIEEALSYTDMFDGRFPMWHSHVVDELPDPFGFKNSATILTLASDTVTVTQNVHTIAAETGTTDDLATINGGTDRQLLIIQADTGDTITVKHGTGNINLNGAADFDLSGDKTLLLFYDGVNWADGGAGGGGGGGHTIQDNGSDMTARANLNFRTGFSLTDDAGNDATIVDAATGGGSKTLQTHTVLHSETLAGAGRFDVSSISQDYDHLIIRAKIRSTVSSTSDIAYLFFNGDTTVTNYFRQLNAALDGSGATPESDTPNIGNPPGASSTSDDFASVEITIFNYTDSKRKTAVAALGGRLDSGREGMYITALNWESTAAINQITLQPDGYSTDNWAIGSYIEIIGIKEEAVGGATYSDANVSSPPTDAELDAEFGTPATVGAGFTAIVDDAGTGTTAWMVISDGTNWWYEELTKAT